MVPVGPPPGLPGLAGGPQAGTWRGEPGPEPDDAGPVRSVQTGPARSAHLGEAVAPSEPSRAVVVDVGGDCGTLIVRGEPADEAREVEIHPVGRPDARTHVWILPRAVAAGTVHAGVFPSLAEGDYVLLGRDGESLRTLHVPGGAVTDVTWG